MKKITSFHLEKMRAGAHAHLESSARITMLIVALCLSGTLPSRAQTIAPAFASNYTYISLGSAPGVPAPYGGLTLLAGNSSTLLLGGSANASGGSIYSVGVTRDGNGHINGFSGGASLFATAPNIDGGLAYGPGGVLFAVTYSNNQMLEYKPGSTSPDKTIDLSAAGIASSTGTVAFVPSGFPGVGGIRIMSFSSGGFYTGTLTADGSGTYDLSAVTLQTNTGNGPEGLIYVPAGSVDFAGSNALISEYSANRVSAYSLDANGYPVAGSRQDFITGLGGAEGAFVDPQTGDFLFSTFGGGSQVVEVQGFAPVTPEPSSAVLLLGSGGMLLLRRRRANSRD